MTVIGIGCCDPGGIQTHDLQNRNLTLYSAKLRSRCGCKINHFILNILFFPQIIECPQKMILLAQKHLLYFSICRKN